MQDGIGPSGMGHYHGHEGFLTFSKAKGVFIKQRFNAARLIYPPYGKSIQKLVHGAPEIRLLLADLVMPALARMDETDSQIMVIPNPMDLGEHDG